MNYFAYSFCGGKQNKTHYVHFNVIKIESVLKMRDLIKRRKQYG